VRLAASGMASLAGFAVDQIEDIKIAVSEILIALIEHGAGNVIDLQLWVADDAFSMRGRTAVTAFDANHPDLRLCRTVLDGVTGHNRIELLDDHATIWAAVPRTAG
jgi:anti-sigma regulatory factor (Ser/Thr protein kinase)